MLKILKIVANMGTPQSRKRYDDDVVDRLNHRYTGVLLILFAVVVSFNQYVGDNIHCWVPAHFSGPWEDYTNQYCWIKNTYYLPFENHIPKAHESDKRHMIPYYQWVPVILLFQAFMFFIPCSLWRALNNRSGIDLNSVIESGWTFYESDTADARKTTLGYMVKQFHRWANYRFLSAKSHRAAGCTTNLKTMLSRIICPVCGKHRGNYLVCLYLITKLLYLVNVIGQIFLLDRLLGYQFHFFGIHVFMAMLVGEDWSQSERFPRVTMCDFNVRMLGNNQRYSVQCALPINLFSEKIFLFLWFWFVFVALITAISLVLWILRIFFTVDHKRYVRNHLMQSHTRTYDSSKSGSLREFVSNYLQWDGILALRMIGHNTDGLTVNEFITALWNHYRRPGDIEMEDIKPTTALT